MGSGSKELDRGPSPRLYAELLPNIRQVTLYVSLPLSQRNTKNYDITLSSDSQTIDVTHDNGSVKLKLPARVSEGSRERLIFNGEQKKGGELSFRLLVSGNTGVGIGSRRALDQQEHEGTDGPWRAARLESKTRIRCRHCKNILLRPHPEIARGSDVSDTVEEKRTASDCGLVFKDLPSQNWAEMMDFWHCHKPDEPRHTHDHNHGHGGDPNDTQDRNGAVKGYGASNRVIATAGTVLVDVSSFVIAEDEGIGLIKVSFA
jgi:hypothetical protein